MEKTPKLNLHPLDVFWWRYILEKPKDERGIRAWIHCVWCRLRCHPAGLVWFNPNGLEPDMHCAGCGDFLG